mgnify:FL=1
MGQVHIFLFIKSSADTMIQRYQHCSRLAVEALVAVLRCTFYLWILFAVYAKQERKKKEWMHE